MSDEPKGEAWTYLDDGQVLRDEMWKPSGRSNGKAVLVVHEADGIGGNVRRHCALLESLGYTAFAADLHGDGRVLDDAEIAPALEHFLNDREALRKRVRAGIDAIQADHDFKAADIAAIGYCFGGTAVLELARSGAPVAAVASFHGLLTTNRPACAGTVAARILVCTGAADPLVPMRDVTAFQDEMIAAKVDWQLMVFGRALHSFTNIDIDRMGDDRMRFDAKAETASWGLLLNFLTSSFDR